MNRCGSELIYEHRILGETIELISEKTIRKQCEKYELFPEYIKSYYKNFANKKVPFANEIKDHITKENSLSILDLKVQIEKLYKSIKKWNE